MHCHFKNASTRVFTISSPIHPSTHPLIFTSNHSPSHHPFIHAPIHPSTYPFTYKSPHPSTYSPMHPLFPLPTYPPNHPHIHSLNYHLLILPFHFYIIFLYPGPENSPPLCARKKTHGAALTSPPLGSALLSSKTQNALSH